MPRPPVSPSPHAPLGRCWASIDLKALERNLRAIVDALPAHVRYVSVVKADAYGHGLAPTVTRLMQAGVHAFAVANVAEVARVREIGTGWPTLVLGPALPEEYPDFFDFDAIATVSSAEECARWSALAEVKKKPARVHLKVDTGMGRVGVWHAEAGPLIELLIASPWLQFEGIFTHFSSADSDPVYTRLQRQRFFRLLERYCLKPSDRFLIHADNSAGLDSFQADNPLNAARIGLLQFGCRTALDSLLRDLPTEPILSLHARVGLIKSLPAGTADAQAQS